MTCHLLPPDSNVPPGSRWQVIREIPHKVARVARFSDMTENSLGGRWHVFLGSSLRARIRTNAETAETCHLPATRRAVKIR
jgi:hypothetical protein